MGYNTEFSGEITVEPPFNLAEIRFLERLRKTMGGTMLHLPLGQPESYLQWAPSEDGTKLAWDGVEKAYCMEEWLRYLIVSFFDRPTDNPYSARFANHVFNGHVEATGEDPEDLWCIDVVDCVVTRKTGQVTYS